MEGKKINFVKAFGLKEFTNLAVNRIETTGYYKKPEEKKSSFVDVEGFATFNVGLVATHCDGYIGRE